MIRTVEPVSGRELEPKFIEVAQTASERASHNGRFGREAEKRRNIAGDGTARGEHERTERASERRGAELALRKDTRTGRVAAAAAIKAARWTTHKRRFFPRYCRYVTYYDMPHKNDCGPRWEVGRNFIRIKGQLASHIKVRARRLLRVQAGHTYSYKHVAEEIFSLAKANLTPATIGLPD